MARVFFDIPPGLIADETTFSSPARWEDGYNIRFWMGRPQPIGVPSQAGGQVTGVCRSMLGFRDTAGDYQIVYGTNSRLQVYKGALYNITPSGLTAGITDVDPLNPVLRVWSLHNWGDAVICSTDGWFYSQPSFYYWNGNTASLATPITTAPARANCSIVLPEQRMVVAFGCSEEVSGAYNGMCIRNSDAEDYADWTTTSSNLASEIILSGRGTIRAAKSIGQFIGVWTDTELYIGQYIGSTLESFRFELVAGNCGVIGPMAVTVFNNVAYWVTPDRQFYRWQVGSSPEIVPCPIRREFYQNLDAAQEYKVLLGNNSRFQEVWIYYPDTRDAGGGTAENSRAFFFSVIDGTWSKANLARTAHGDGLERNGGLPLKGPHAVGPDGYVYYHDLYTTGANLDFSIQSSDFYLDDASRLALIRGVWPDFENVADAAPSGSYSLTIYFRDKPQSTTETTYGPYTVGLDTEKVDFMAHGRIASVKVSGNGSGTALRIGRFSFDVVPTGEH